MPFSDAVLIDNKTLYIAGRIGLVPGTRTVPESIEEEVDFLMRDIIAILSLAEMSMKDLTYLQIFCPDVSLWEQFNALYLEYFESSLPARAFIGSGPLLFGARFEAQGIAVRCETDASQ